MGERGTAGQTSRRELTAVGCEKQNLKGVSGAVGVRVAQGNSVAQRTLGAVCRTGHSI